MSQGPRPPRGPPTCPSPSEKETRHRARPSASAPSTPLSLCSFSTVPIPLSDIDRQARPTNGACSSSSSTCHACQTDGTSARSSSSSALGPARPTAPAPERRPRRRPGLPDRRACPTDGASSPFSSTFVALCPPLPLPSGPLVPVAGRSVCCLQLIDVRPSTRPRDDVAVVSFVGSSFLTKVFCPSIRRASASRSAGAAPRRHGPARQAFGHRWHLAAAIKAGQSGPPGHKRRGWVPGSHTT